MQRKIIETLSDISYMLIAYGKAQRNGEQSCEIKGFFRDDVFYIQEIIDCVPEKTERVWFPVRRSPTPQIPLKLKLDTGEIIDGVRPSYIASYGESDLGYRDSADNILLNVVSWAIA